MDVFVVVVVVVVVVVSLVSAQPSKLGVAWQMLATTVTVWLNYII